MTIAFEYTEAEIMEHMKPYIPKHCREGLLAELVRLDREASR